MHSARTHMDSVDFVPVGVTPKTLHDSGRFLVPWVKPWTGICWRPQLIPTPVFIAHLIFFPLRTTQDRCGSLARIHHLTHMHIVSSSSFRHGILIFVLSDRRGGRSTRAHPLPLLRPGPESSHRWPSAENLRGILEVSTPRCKHVHCIFFLDSHFLPRDPSRC
jgi:hypothetical protein